MGRTSKAGQWPHVVARLVNRSGDWNQASGRVIYSESTLAMPSYARHAEASDT